MNAVTCPVCEQIVQAVGDSKIMEPHDRTEELDVTVLGDQEPRTVEGGGLCPGSYRSAIQGIRVPRASN